MSGKLIRYCGDILIEFQNIIISIIERQLQPGFCINALNEQAQKPRFSIKDVVNEAFIWAVPKHRRSLEKRLSRKFGFPKYNWKPLVPKTNLLMCRRCGQFHESYTICGHCYQNVKKETKSIQEIIDKLKPKPVKEELVILYAGEKELKSREFWKGQRIVEVTKKRPSWFHQNLLQPTTQKLSDSKEIKPNDLA